MATVRALSPEEGGSSARGFERADRGFAELRLCGKGRAGGAGLSDSSVPVGVHCQAVVRVDAESEHVLFPLCDQECSCAPRFIALPGAPIKSIRAHGPRTIVRRWRRRDTERRPAPAGVVHAGFDRPARSVLITDAMPTYRY
jgi:hypothetical protein